MSTTCRCTLHKRRQVLRKCLRRSAPVKRCAYLKGR